MHYSNIMLMLGSRRYVRDNKTLISQHGFTIVEMMMATLVFSVIMLVAAGTVVRFTSNFQRGVTASTTQNTARSIIDTVSQSLQLYGDDFSRIDNSSGMPVGYCVGSTMYSFILGRQMADGGQRHVLIEQKEGLPIGCGSSALNLAGNPANPPGQELLAPDMRLAKFEIVPQGDGLFRLTIKVAYGDNDLLCSPTAGNCNSETELGAGDFSNQDILNDLQCKGTKGSEYCAVSEITTTIQRRV